MANFIGTALLWLIAIVMIAVFPLSEFARGMASATGLKASRGGRLVSIVGLVLLALLVREALA